jgi:hypothetical protein
LTPSNAHEEVMVAHVSNAMPPARNRRHRLGPVGR